MTEQELKDEREQAVKRGGEIYADHYMEGLIDGRNLALSQTAVIGCPSFGMINLKTKELIQWQIYSIYSQPQRRKGET